jgi:hypothetical protein
VSSTKIKPHKQFSRINDQDVVLQVSCPFVYSRSTAAAGSSTVLFDRPELFKHCGTLGREVSVASAALLLKLQRKQPSFKLQRSQSECMCMMYSARGVSCCSCALAHVHALRWCGVCRFDSIQLQRKSRRIASAQLSSAASSQSPHHTSSHLHTTQHQLRASRTTPHAHTSCQTTPPADRHPSSCSARPITPPRRSTISSPTHPPPLVVRHMIRSHSRRRSRRRWMMCCRVTRLPWMVGSM